MASLGEKLKEARLKQGLSINEVAGKTRIQVHFLDAIEADKLEVIPGAFFRKSFVRQYADMLGVNVEQFESDTTIQFGSFPSGAHAVTDQLPTREQPDLPPLPTPGREGGPPLRQALLSLGLLIGVVAVCAVAYMFWEDFQARERNASNPALPSRIEPSPEAIPEPGPTNPIEQTTPGAEAEGAGTQPSDLLPGATPESETESEPTTPGNAPPEQVAASPSAQPTPPPATPASVPGAESTPSEAAPAKNVVYGSGTRELRLTADSLTWVRVREGERTVFIGTIEAGQSRLIRVIEGAQILTGNAGSLKVMWQGNDVGKIGPTGQVRTVTVSPDGVRIQAPAPKTPPAESEVPADTGRVG